jgi:hypothetical protein
MISNHPFSSPASAGLFCFYFALSPISIYLICAREIGRNAINKVEAILKEKYELPDTPDRQLRV